MVFRSILRKNFPVVELLLLLLFGLVLFVNVFRCRVHRGPHFVFIILHRETPANLLCYALILQLNEDKENTKILSNEDYSMIV